MGASAFKNKKGKNLTRKMLVEKIEEMTTLLIYMEQALTEWEVWHRLLKLQEEGNTIDEWKAIVFDGPIFEHSMTSKIMESVRENVPEFKPKTEEEIAGEKLPALLDANGNVIEKSAYKDVDENGQENTEEDT